MPSLGSLRTAARIGVRAMRANPIRALLSTLGVVIGCGALVSVLAVSDGVEQYARSRASHQGFDRITIRSITEDTVDGQWVSRQNVAKLGASDVEALATVLGEGQRAVLQLQGVALATIGVPSRQRALALRGVTFIGSDTPDSALLVGRNLTAGETSAGAPVALANLALATAMVGDAPNVAARALGDSVRLGGRWVRIIGVKADDASDGPRQGLTLVAPLAMAERAFVSARRASLAPSLEVSTGRAEELRGLRGRVEAWLQYNDPQWAHKYRIESRSESQLLDLERALLIFRLLMGSITGITLIVGGIGIMNVLLASVAERTREIGIRKAIGARRSDILLQFLAEAVAITGVGSLMGMALGLAVAYGTTAVMRAETNAVIYAATTPKTLAIGASLSILVGIVFGCYPAALASRLTPVEAIHTE